MCALAYFAGAIMNGLFFFLVTLSPTSACRGNRGLFSFVSRVGVSPCLILPAIHTDDLLRSYLRCLLLLFGLPVGLFSLLPFMLSG